MTAAATASNRTAARVAAFLLLTLLTANAVAQGGPPPVTAAKPVLREIVEDDQFVGRFEAVEEVVIRSRVGGYLDAVHFRDGAIVSRGDLLFTIDQRPFQTALEQAKAALEVARTTVDFAEAQLKRAEPLAAAGNLSVSALDDRRREFLAAQAQVEGAKATLARAALDMEYTEIRAPLSGRIDRHLVSVGNLVQTDQTILTTIVSLDPIQFYFDIDERQFLGYARDAKARGKSLQEGSGDLEVTVDIADRDGSSVKGTLDFAENRLDKASGTMRVRAILPNPDYVLQPGLFGRIHVPGSLPYMAVLVPDDAIGADQDRRIVFVVGGDGTVSAKPVRLGPKIHGYRVIRSGLSGDETIVINGLMRVRPGAKVTPTLVTLPPDLTGQEAGQ